MIIVYVFTVSYVMSNVRSSVGVANICAKCYKKTYISVTDENKGSLSVTRLIDNKYPYIIKK